MSAIDNLPGGWQTINVTHGWHMAFEVWANYGAGGYVGHFDITIDNGPNLHVYMSGLGWTIFPAP